MPEKFFLALDYATDEEALERGTSALDALKSEFGSDFVKDRVGVKINEDLLTDTINPQYSVFPNIFADMKISHGADTGERIIRRITQKLPLRYVTVLAGLGSTILGEYVLTQNRQGIYVIAFTAHTKIPEGEVSRMYRGSLDDTIYNLSWEAHKAGCHAVVLEGDRLRNLGIRDIPIKKLVTGIRIDPSDRGTQSRVTSLGDLSYLKDHVDYVVVSSRYINNPSSLGGYVAALM